MDALIHYPPPYNPDYERECDEFNVWDMERRLGELERRADELFWIAADLDAEGRIQEAAVAEKRYQTAQREFENLKQELDDFERGW